MTIGRQLLPKHGTYSAGRVTEGRIKILSRRPAESRLAELPSFIPPELATLVDQPPEGSAWVHEIKLDGYRTAARIEGGKVRPVDPHRLDRAARFPLIARRASRPASRSWNISTAATARRPPSRAYAERCLSSIPHSSGSS